MALRSRRRSAFRFLLVTIFTLIFVFVCFPVAQENYKLLCNLEREQMEKDDVDFQKQQLNSEAVNANSNQKPPRRNIIIVAHGRSGSTILGDIFNHHPFVFYLHEPLQTVERLRMKSAGKSYGSLMADFLTGMFRCNFNKSVVEDLDFFYRDPSHPRASRALGSPPLCPYEMTDPRWAPNLCPTMTSELLNGVCRHKYFMNAAKILIPRITERSIKHILPACNHSDVDCKIIFLIRDPRPVIGSSRSVGFFKDAASDTNRESLRRFSSEKCQETEQNFAFVKNLPLRWRNRIMIQRYEDFAENPLDGLSRLYTFAGLPVLESVKIWLHNATTPTKKRGELCNEVGDIAFCTVDNASAAVNRWRLKIPLSDIDIIEKNCKHVMQAMGYKLVDGSQELMSNISVPLFNKDFEAKDWF